MGQMAVPNQGICDNCGEERLRPDGFMEKTVNICGLCLSQPRMRSLLEAGVLGERWTDRRCKHACTTGRYEA